MSKDCELQSVSEIVTEMANILRQADMTQFWEIHFFPDLLWINISLQLLETSIRGKLRKKTDPRDREIED